jgi:hypothetical protein
MNLQTGTIEITGLSQEILQTIDRKAREAGSTAEAYVRTLIEQEYALLSLSPLQLETLRQEVAAGRDQIQQGQCRTYDSADAMMDDIENELQQRLGRNQPETIQ